MIFEPTGTGFSVLTANSTVTGEALVGGGVDGGANFPTSGTTDVSGHYGFRDDVAIANLGSHIVSSVGDVSFGGTANTDIVGDDHLLPGTVYSGAEMPPNGSSFATINDATDASVGPYGVGLFATNGVWIQNETTISLLYDGTLSGILDMRPLFGTNGLAIPEPSTAALVGLGLAGLAVTGRRRKS